MTSDALLLVGTLIFFLIVGLPVFLAIGASILAYMVVTRGLDIPFEVLAQRMIFGIDGFTLLAVPLFLLVGRVMNESGASSRLFDFADAVIGWLRGGLGHVNVLGSIIFAGMSGTYSADVAGLGKVEIDNMRARGYDPGFSAGITVASSLVGPIIPPSVLAILYAMLAEVSATDLLIAGLIPGLLMGFALMVHVAILARLRPSLFPTPSSFSPKRIVSTGWYTMPALLTPVILIGGILTGIFTTTEAAAVAVMYALFVGLAIYREIKVLDLFRIIREAAVENGVLMLILALATVYAWVATRARVPQAAAELIFSVSTEPLVVMAMIICFLVIVGLFISASEAIIILTPILVPVVKTIGIDPLWFGIIMMMAVTIGGATPPFGFALFIVSKVSNISFGRVAYSTLPFLCTILLVISFVVVFPGIATFLPSVLD